jgi:hypothetical protein
VERQFSFAAAYFQGYIKGRRGTERWGKEFFLEKYFGGGGRMGD